LRAMGRAASVDRAQARSYIKPWLRKILRVDEQHSAALVLPPIPA
jgi:hypothetical protein